MQNYGLMRFVRLNLYFFVMYSVLTAIWYGISGKYGEVPLQDLLEEILLNAAIFSLLFSLTILFLYRRTSLRIPVTKYKMPQLQKKLEEAGFLKAATKDDAVQVYKPVPPKAPALAGKVFVQKTTNFYVVHGPAKYLKEL